MLQLSLSEFGRDIEQWIVIDCCMIFFIVVFKVFDIFRMIPLTFIVIVRIGMVDFDMMDVELRLFVFMVSGESKVRQFPALRLELNPLVTTYPAIGVRVQQAHHGLLNLRHFRFRYIRLLERVLFLVILHAVERRDIVGRPDPRTVQVV